MRSVVIVGTAIMLSMIVTLSVSRAFHIGMGLEVLLSAILGGVATFILERVK